MKYIITICFVFLILCKAGAQNNADAILGKWESAEKNLIVEIYKQDNSFKAKIVWFYDNTDTITPIDQRLDVNNPNKNLRSGKIIGLDVLSGLVYNPKEKKWVNGKIYDSSSGRTWSATVWLISPQNMVVRGFYVFRFLGKTLNFYRI